MTHVYDVVDVLIGLMELFRRESLAGNSQSRADFLCIRAQACQSCCFPSCRRVCAVVVSQARTQTNGISNKACDCTMSTQCNIHSWPCGDHPMYLSVCLDVLHAVGARGFFAAHAATRAAKSQLCDSVRAFDSERAAAVI